MSLSRRFFQAAVVLAILGCTAASAQNLDQMAFFQSHSRTAYRYNPAIISQTGFVGVGGIALNTRANVGITTFIYEYGGETVTALNKLVSVNRFLDQLHPDNHLVGDTCYNLFSYGFARDKSFHTVELNFRALAEVSLPKDLFVLLKTGVKKNTFNFSNARVDLDSYIECAYGYSRKLSDVVSVGARAKLLVGLASSDARISDFHVAWAEEGKTSASFDASLDLMAKEKSKNIGTFLHPEFDPKLPPVSAPSGLGMSFDLGVLITPGDYLTLSASVADLGFLCWFYKKGGYLAASFSIDDFMQYYSEEMEWFELMALAFSTYESLETSAEFKATKSHTRVHALPFGFNLGLKYAMPFYKPLSIGLTGHLTTFHKAPFWDTRFGVDLAPFNWLDISGTIGCGTYGMNWGLAGSVRIDRFRLQFALSDNFGGTVPGTNKHLKPWNRVLTAGLFFDL